MKTTRRRSIQAVTWSSAAAIVPWQTPVAGSTEVWEIYNLSEDVHPMHFHLVNVQVINRQPFDPETFNGDADFTGPAVAPAASEVGWKDTVRMYPGTVTRVIMKFDVPTIIRQGDPPGPNDRPGYPPPGRGHGEIVSIPSSPRTGGNEYVWHCHILEDEEHEDAFIGRDLGGRLLPSIVLWGRPWKFTR